MEKLITATGKQFDCDSFNIFHERDRVYIHVHGLSFVKAAEIFSDPRETVQLWCGGQYVANHTRVISIGPAGETVRISLGKE
jgi:hypothetical protein